MRTSIGQLLVNDALPEDLRDYSRTLDKKSLSALLTEVAERYPEEYRDISHKLSRIGQHVAYTSGGNSVGLEDMLQSKSAKAARRILRVKLERLNQDDTLTDEQRDEQVLRLVGKLSATEQDTIYDESLAEDNPLARQILSGSRGSKMNLASLRGSDLLYTDHRGNAIPFPILRSYSQGLTPAEYWAGSYGARKGIIDLKFATQDAGFLSKQLNQIIHRSLVTDMDHDGEPDTLRGLPVDVTDNDNEGSLLARPAGGYARNTVLTPKILARLRKKKIKRILVRSPAVSGAPDGGVYSRDVGIREFGRLPYKGENVGLAAAQALSEPLTQAQISSKHSGGVASSAAEKAIGGFERINQLVQTPKTFKGGAAHSTLDGTVQFIEDAPAGGKYVMISNEKHYVGAGFDLKVRRGDKVEAGDVISEGTPNPAIIVQHKGIGEGRRYFINTFRDAFKAAGIKGHRRNIELLARGLINHVRLTEEAGDFAPDDIVPYSMLEHSYKPRDDSRDIDAKRAVGQYLERPYLHHSIGTKVRPSMLTDFKDFGIKQLRVHKEPPPFEAEMVRGMANMQHDPDWITRMFGSGLKSSLLKGVHRGASSEETGTSFVPGLAKAVNFGQVGKVITPKPPQDDQQRAMSSIKTSSPLVRQAEAMIKQAEPPPLTGIGAFEDSAKIDKLLADALGQQRLSGSRVLAEIQKEREASGVKFDKNRSRRLEEFSKIRETEDRARLQATGSRFNENAYKSINDVLWELRTRNDMLLDAVKKTEKRPTVTAPKWMGEFQYRAPTDVGIMETGLEIGSMFTPAWPLFLPKMIPGATDPGTVYLSGGAKVEASPELQAIRYQISPPAFYESDLPPYDIEGATLNIRGKFQKMLPLGGGIITPNKVPESIPGGTWEEQKWNKHVADPENNPAPTLMHLDQLAKTMQEDYPDEFERSYTKTFWPHWNKSQRMELIDNTYGARHQQGIYVGPKRSVEEIANSQSLPPELDQFMVPEQYKDRAEELNRPYNSNLRNDYDFRLEESPELSEKWKSLPDSTQHMINKKIDDMISSYDKDTMKHDDIMPALENIDALIMEAPAKELHQKTGPWDAPDEALAWTQKFWANSARYPADMKDLSQSMQTLFSHDTDFRRKNEALMKEIGTSGGVGFSWDAAGDWMEQAIARGDMKPEEAANYMNNLAGAVMNTPQDQLFSTLSDIYTSLPLRPGERFEALEHDISPTRRQLASGEIVDITPSPPGTTPSLSGSAFGGDPRNAPRVEQPPAWAMTQPTTPQPAKPRGLLAGGAAAQKPVKSFAELASQVTGPNLERGMQGRMQMPDVQLGGMRTLGVVQDVSGIGTKMPKQPPPAPTKKINPTDISGTTAIPPVPSG